MKGVLIMATLEIKPCHFCKVTSEYLSVKAFYIEERAVGDIAEKLDEFPVSFNVFCGT